MHKTTKTLASLFLASQGYAANGPLTEKVQEWFGFNEYASDNTTILRDLKGQTGWTTSGEGTEKTLLYQFSVAIEQYGADAILLPPKIGFLWALPTAKSKPDAQDWEVGEFYQPSTTTQKRYDCYNAEKTIDLTIGKAPSITKRTDVFGVVYDRAVDSGVITLAKVQPTNVLSKPPDARWDLVPSKSSITSRKQTLVLQRSSKDALAALDLKTGTTITCYFAIKTDTSITSASKGVMLRWAEETASTALLKKKQPSAEQEDGSFTRASLSALAVTFLALGLIN